MRVIKDLNHPACKITIFSWNGKYLIKLEQGELEQTFKIDEMDVMDEQDLEHVLNEEFISDAILRFKEMNDSLVKATDHLI